MEAIPYSSGLVFLLGDRGLGWDSSSWEAIPYSSGLVFLLVIPSYVITSLQSSNPLLIGSSISTMLVLSFSSNTSK